MGLFERIYKSDLTDRELAAFWHAVRDSGRDAGFAYCLPTMDDAGFVAWMRKPDIHPWIVRCGGVPIGLFLLTDVQGKTAQVHFCLLPCGSHRVSIVDGKASLESRQADVAKNATTQADDNAAPGFELGTPSIDTYNAKSRLLEEEYLQELRKAREKRRGELSDEEALGTPFGPYITHEGAEVYEPPKEHGRLIRLPVPVAAGFFCLAQALWEKDAAGLYKLDHLIGITPESNEAAARFAKRLGGEYCGRVPGFCWFERERANVDGIIRHYCREYIPEFWKTL